jgi:hypothetical protein
MNIKNVFTYIKNLVITFIVGVFVLMNLGALLLVVFGIIEFSSEEWNTPQYHCADDGGVWDDEKEICRYDCDVWDKEKGCIIESKVDAMKQEEQKNLQNQ